MDPWTRPIFDTFRETYTAKELDKMTEDGVIEIVPLGFMRGRTFKNTWIIADEMQNSSPTQMFMLATRIGEGSKMIITGDLNQSDLNPRSNGLLEIYGKIRAFERTGDLDCVQYVELDKEDVQRSRAAKTVLNIYDPVVVPCLEFELDDQISEKLVEYADEEEPYVPLEYSDYKGDNQFTNEFEYLDPATNAIETTETTLIVDCFTPLRIKDEQSAAHSSPEGGVLNDKGCKPNEWVHIDNDAALIPIHHISKHFDNSYKRY
jgi:hypothetical protein